METVPKTTPPRPLHAGRLGLRTDQSLMALGVLLLIHLLLLAEVRLGLIPLTPVRWFVAGSLLASLLLFALVRSGWSERLSREHSLSMPQMVCAQLCTVWAYTLAGPARGALLPLMPLILCFGMFALDERVAAKLMWLGISLLGGACALQALGLRGSAQSVHLELVHWTFTSVAMLAIGVLARRLGRMRHRLRERQTELSEALERIRALATLDALTGLLNRRAMLEELTREAARMARGGDRMTLVLVDLDHFKRVNDNLGHRMGDRVLQAFADVARQVLRSSDRVARWGGEEFLILMPQTTNGDAAAAMSRIRDRLRAQAIEGLPSDWVITFSAGVAWCGSEPALNDAIDRADLAMYQAKAGGRDRVVSAQDVVATEPTAVA